MVDTCQSIHLMNRKDRRAVSALKCACLRKKRGTRTEPASCLLSAYPSVRRES